MGLTGEELPIATAFTLVSNQLIGCRGCVVQISCNFEAIEGGYIPGKFPTSLQLELV